MCLRFVNIVDYMSANNYSKLDVIAIVISIFSLAASLWSAREANKNTWNTNRPYVTVVPMWDKSNKPPGIYLNNAGLGPAILIDMSVTIQGRTYSGLGPDIWPKFEQDMGFSDTCFKTAWPRPYDVLKAGEETPLFVIGENADALCHAKLATVLSDDLRIHVAYQSSYEKPYTYDGSAHMYSPRLTELSAAGKKLDATVDQLLKSLDGPR
ncbi:hypothetical protein [Burkholderia pseudomallei]|uniref:hypothetical protein n=1 Tax=Burkholderia pseudomallei TaxID=28450 RepID=UPI000F4F3208|nr:hypothetical protein [Burkholderia pseudomallei]RSK61350.1 hypothetical protein DF122_24420 [Burkholderia pseudomallei]